MFDFNVEDVDTSNEFKGDFLARIKSVKEGKTKTNKDMMVLEFDFVGMQNITMKSWYVIDNQTSKGTKKLFEIIDFLEVDRKEFTKNYNLIVGKTVMLKVGKDNKDDKYSSILKVYKTEKDTSFDTENF